MTASVDVKLSLVERKSDKLGVRVLDLKLELVCDIPRVRRCDQCAGTLQCQDDQVEVEAVGGENSHDCTGGDACRVSQAVSELLALPTQGSPARPMINVSFNKST